MAALTLCSGNVLNMSPEALDKSKSYTAKLDVFSLGVIVIHIVAKLFPNPTIVSALFMFRILMNYYDKLFQTLSNVRPTCG